MPEDKTLDTDWPCGLMVLAAGLTVLALLCAGLALFWTLVGLAIVLGLWALQATNHFRRDITRFIRDYDRAVCGLRAHRNSTVTASTPGSTGAHITATREGLAILNRQIQTVLVDAHIIGGLKAKQDKIKHWAEYTLGMAFVGGLMAVGIGATRPSVNVGGALFVFAALLLPLFLQFKFTRDPVQLPQINSEQEARELAEAVMHALTSDDESIKRMLITQTAEGIEGAYPEVKKGLRQVLQMLKFW